jgi:histidinol phosphatase-like enzyme (inositol monophosphatase family)
MNPEQLDEMLDFAVEAAEAAGRFTMQHFLQSSRYDLKKDGTPVTVADRGAEEIMRLRIEKAYPKHGILGEELGEKKGSEPARWILDPIDGTFSFVSGVPLYTNLIGLEWEGEMVLGVINAPALGEVVYAAKGQGAWWNGDPARVSKETSLSEARLSTTSSHLMAECGREATYQRLRDQCKTDRGWADAYGYLLLATGRVDIMIDPVMNIWDTAALMPVVTEAGGTFTDWKGNATHTAPEALATNGKLHSKVVQCLGAD